MTPERERTLGIPKLLSAAELKKTPPETIWANTFIVAAKPGEQQADAKARLDQYSNFLLESFSRKMTGAEQSAAVDALRTITRQIATNVHGQGIALDRREVANLAEQALIAWSENVLIPLAERRHHAE